MLHSAFLYPGSGCTVELPLPGTHTTVPVAGEIVRCVHMQGLIHELGIKFARPIDARAYLDTSPDSGFAFEKVDPSSLSGMIVCLEDSKLDQKLIQHYLRTTRIRVKFAETAKAAVEAIGPDCDLVLCDQGVHEGKGLQAVAYIQKQHPELPVLLMSNDTGSEIRRAASELQINAFLKKPIVPDMLLQALSEFLLLRQMFGRGPRQAAGGRSHASVPGAVATEMNSAAEKMERAMADDDAMSAYVAVMQVKSTAPAAGLDTVARLADQAAAALGKTMSATASKSELESLISACKRAATGVAA